MECAHIESGVARPTADKCLPKLRNISHRSWRLSFSPVRFLVLVIFIIISYSGQCHGNFVVVRRASSNRSRRQTSARRSSQQRQRWMNKRRNEKPAQRWVSAVVLATQWQHTSNSCGFFLTGDAYPKHCSRHSRYLWTIVAADGRSLFVRECVIGFGVGLCVNGSSVFPGIHMGACVCLCVRTWSHSFILRSTAFGQFSCVVRTFLAWCASRRFEKLCRLYAFIMKFVFSTVSMHTHRDVFFIFLFDSVLQ